MPLRVLEVRHPLCDVPRNGVRRQRVNGRCWRRMKVPRRGTQGRRRCWMSTAAGPEENAAGQCCDAFKLTIWSAIVRREQFVRTQKAS